VCECVCLRERLKECVCVCVCDRECVYEGEKESVLFVCVCESFAGYSNLGWHLCSLRVCMTSVQDLLAFIVSSEKSGVIIFFINLSISYIHFECYS